MRPNLVVFQRVLEDTGPSDPAIGRADPAWMLCDNGQSNTS
jgi:hypothetical protein